jgi:hypothetical protein
MAFERYEQLPSHLAERIVSDAGREHEHAAH